MPDTKKKKQKADKQFLKVIDGGLGPKEAENEFGVTIIPKDHKKCLACKNCIGLD
jgi:hypothetical protein